MKTMKKMLLIGPGKTEVRDVPVPEFNDDQLLVKLVYHGVCMSEHYAWEHAETDNGVDEGFGHEPCGIVEAVGKNVD